MSCGSGLPGVPCLIHTNIYLDLMKDQPPQVADRFTACWVGEVVLVTNHPSDFQAYPDLRIENGVDS